MDVCLFSVFLHSFYPCICHARFATTQMSAEHLKLVVWNTQNTIKHKWRNQDEDGHDCEDNDGDDDGFGDDSGNEFVFHNSLWKINDDEQ